MAQLPNKIGVVEKIRGIFMAEKNSQENFIEAYDKYADGIFRHIYFRIYDREIAKELMQETFTKTWEYLASGKKVDFLKAFLYQVAKNLLVSFIRKKKAISLDELMENGMQLAIEDEQEKNIQNMEVDYIISKINKLPQKYAYIIKMKYLEDLSPKQIGKIIGKSENFVSVRINRGLNKLRKNLNFSHGIR